MFAKRIHVLAVGALLIASLQVAAAPVTISTPFFNYENDAINSLGFSSGQFLRFGANSVVPNGANGTTGVATTTNLVSGALVSRTINYTPDPIIPNFFQRRIAIDPNLLGPWTLSFANGADSSQAVVSLPAGASIAPFVNSITLSGTSANPTFSWTPPPNATVNAYRINIYDKSLINNTPGAINTGQVTSRDLQPNVTSYTVTAADFTVPGYGFTNANYSIEISLIQTKDGTTNSNNSNLASIARVYADFTPNNGGGPPVNLPVVLVNGSYQFNISVLPGQTYYIDPLVATGYDYAIGAGDPNFQSVILPVGIGDGFYDIFGYDSNGNLVLLADNWAGGVAFNFGNGGVSRFRITDIEASAGLDPSNTTAFITGLTFTGAGKFTGTQTPITVNVPEPPMMALLLAAMVALRIRRAPKGR